MQIQQRPESSTVTINTPPGHDFFYIKIILTFYCDFDYFIENNVFHSFIGGMEENYYVLTLLNSSVFWKHPVEIKDVSNSLRNFAARCVYMHCTIFQLSVFHRNACGERQEEKG